MSVTLRRYLLTLATLWIALSAAGILYANTLEIPTHAAAAVIAACLVEIALYILPAFLPAQTMAPWRLALAFAVSGLPPYFVYAALTGTFSIQGFLLVAALACAASFWFVVLSRSPVFDLLFLVMMAAVFLSKIFDLAYLPLVEAPKVPVAYFGRLMWIRLGISSALFLRRAGGVGFGFIPRREDWKLGFLHNLGFQPVAVALNYALGFAHLRAMPQDWLKFAATTVATFFGMLWVPVLAEEFFFRGLLQQWIEKWTSSRWAALFTASLLFSAVHLPFPNMAAFPNWRFALLAFFAGLFYGHAYRSAESVRAAMVAHALINVTWRMLFR